MKKLVLGLGNPGKEYERTRHNIGFMLIDKLAHTVGAEWRLRTPLHAHVAEAGDLVLAKPTTYMNLSGTAAAALAYKYAVKPCDTLVVCDDLNLPFASMRLRMTGTAGGHNGLKDIIAKFGTLDFPRLKYGIGRPADKDQVTAYVLGAFTDDERRRIDSDIALMVQWLMSWRGGETLETLMGTVNGNEKKQTDGHPLRKEGSDAPA
jgi:PTH1 family peptidyl-tRNA hydrolase